MLFDDHVWRHLLMSRWGKIAATAAAAIGLIRLDWRANARADYWRYESIYFDVVADYVVEEELFHDVWVDLFQLIQTHEKSFESILVYAHTLVSATTLIIAQLFTGQYAQRLHLVSESHVAAFRLQIVVQALLHQIEHQRILKI